MYHQQVVSKEIPGNIRLVKPKMLLCGHIKNSAGSPSP